ncbi:hypothetical protein GCM10023231_05650 [Olivibacter ginsenosidimutans]|uniref:DUF3857 domain-containing protein n=2 Tax=Olivibacter ginsenosidimutans TaxID=1176537 RepID=A0ABP9AJ72_9SPHI
MGIKVWGQADFAIDHIPEHLRLRANAIMRDRQYTIDMHATNEVVLHVKEVLTIMNKSALAYARLALFYDKNTVIKDIHGALYDGQGQLMQKISAKDFLDESAVNNFSLFEDSRVKHFLPNGLEYPFTVMYDFELKFKQNLIIPDWVPKPYRDMAVEQSSYQFICGLEDKLHIKESNYTGKRTEERNQKQKSYTWMVKSLPAGRIEPLSPPPESYQTRVKIAPEQFYYYRKKGGYTNWRELGQWVYNDLIKEQQLPTPSMISQVNGLVDNLTDNREKIKVLYEYLQQKTRYVSVQIGIGGFQPMAASEVDRLGYGDCKGLVNYMQTLLNIAEIPSYYCVVNAGSLKKDMELDFASMNQGNHVILAVPLKQDTVWLECTSQKIPFGFLGDFTDDRLVFACTPHGGELLRTPKYTPMASTQQRKAIFSLNSEGDIHGAFSTRFKGAQYDNRLGIADMPLNEQTKTLKQIYAIDNIDFTQVAYADQPAEDTPCMQEDVAINIRHYAPKNGQLIYLQPNLFNRQGSVPQLEKRESPFYLNRGYTDEDILTYTVPDQYVLRMKPADVKLETDFGDFVMELTLTDRQLVYHRKLSLREGQFPPERYIDYARFMNAVYQADLTKVVFLEKEH